MNTKNNKRHRDTLMKIENAFIELLSEKEISQIKVSSLCDMVSINRSTFYANYVDIYDLADKLRGRLKTEVHRLLEKDVGWNYTEESFLLLFRHIKENQTLYNFYFKLGYDNDDFIDYDICYDGMGYEQETVDYHIAFFKSGLNAIIKKWLAGGCKETPEMMRDILLYEYRGRLKKEKK